MGQLLMLINLQSTFPFLIGFFFPRSFVGAGLPPAYIRTRLDRVVRVRRALMAYFDDLHTSFHRTQCIARLLGEKKKAVLSDTNIPVISSK